MNAAQKIARAMENPNTVTVAEYQASIITLLALAKHDTGGSKAAAQVLLNAYNGYEFHLDITDLCLLDDAHYQAALVVIRGRVELSMEPHLVIDNGAFMFGLLFERWVHLSNAERHQELYR